MFAYANTIVDEELGSSSITVITSIWNLSMTVTNTIGLKMIKYVNYYFYIAFFLILQVSMVFLNRNKAREIDESNPKL
jgi:hypothetical protein